MISTNKILDAIVICGPSGVGKGTLLKKLFAEYPNRFAYSVSHTTRNPRAGEENGREYHFVSRDTITAMRDNNEFLELCDVHGNYYGTSVAAVKAVQDSGKTCVIEIDVCGAQKLRDRSDGALNATYFFITAPLEELRKRIKGRGADSEETIARRLATAETEYAFLKTNPSFFSGLIVNDELDSAYGRLVQVINGAFSQHQMPPLQK